MLGIVAWGFLVVLGFKFIFSMNRHHAYMIEFGVEPFGARMLQISPLLYMPVLIAYWLPLAAPFRFGLMALGLLMLVPGIILGAKYAKSLERSGVDVGVQAGRAASNVMWLGVGVAVFIVGNEILSALVRDFDSLR